MSFRRTLIGLVALIGLISVSCNFVSGVDDARDLAERFLNDRFTSGSVGNEAYY